MTTPTRRNDLAHAVRCAAPVSPSMREASRGPHPDHNPLTTDQLLDLLQTRQGREIADRYMAILDARRREPEVRTS